MARALTFLEQGCADITFRRGSRAHSVPSDPGWTASPICSRLICGRHNGSWLDLAESELGVLSSQCLDRRIPDKQTLIEEIAAWEHDRNASKTKANWHLTTPNARVKLKYLYPSI